MPAPTTPIIDTFTGSAGVTLPTYNSTNWGNWTNVTSSDLKIDSTGTKCEAGSGIVRASYRKEAQPGPNCEAYVTIANQPFFGTNKPSLFGIGIRYTVVNGGGANGIAVEYDVAASGNDVWRLSNVVAGTGAELARVTGGNNLVSGNKVWLNAIGTTVTVYRWNGTTWVTVMSATTAVNNAGWITLYQQGAAGEIQMDDLGGGTVAGGSLAPSNRRQHQTAILAR